MGTANQRAESNPNLSDHAFTLARSHSSMHEFMRMATAVRYGWEAGRNGANR